MRLVGPVLSLLLLFAPGMLPGQTAPPPPDAKAAQRACPANAKRAIFSQKDTGEVLEGPVCVGVLVNGLRYSAELARAVTITAGPNLSAAIAAAPSPGGGRTAESAGVGDIRTELTTQRALAAAYDLQNAQSAAAVAKAVSELKALVAQSDDIYRSNGPAGVLAAAKDAQLTASIEGARRAIWSATDNVYAKLKALQGRASDLLLNNPPDPDKAALAGLQTAIANLLGDIAPSVVNGEKTAAFYRQKGIVDYWSRLISGLTEDSFVLTTYVPCGITLNQSKQIALRLLQSDRLPAFEGQPPGAADLKDPFITVSCSSAFVVSAGVEFRFLKTSTFGLVPSGSTGANQFGVTDQQNKIPLPLAMAHVRLAQDASHRVGLYGSFGVGCPHGRQRFRRIRRRIPHRTQRRALAHHVPQRRLALRKSQRSRRRLQNRGSGSLRSDHGPRHELVSIRLRPGRNVHEALR
jgi:hypothetical protein